MSEVGGTTPYCTCSLFPHAFHHLLSFLSEGYFSIETKAIKCFTETACLLSSNQKKRLCALEEKNWGLLRNEPLPLSLSCARKVWSAGAGVCQALAAARGCDVSHFRYWTVQCTARRHFSSFLFLSCQIQRLLSWLQKWSDSSEAQKWAI